DLFVCFLLKFRWRSQQIPREQNDEKEQQGRNPSTEFAGMFYEDILSPSKIQCDNQANYDPYDLHNGGSHVSEPAVAQRVRPCPYSDSRPVCGHWYRP